MCAEHSKGDLDVPGTYRTDAGDMPDLEHILRAYCLGGLEVQVRIRDGTLHALRTNAAQLGFPGSVFELFPSGRKEWRRIG